MGYFDDNNNDYLGSYMKECPRCHNRYNKRSHPFKCPDCGYLNINYPLVIAILVVVISVLFLSGFRIFYFIDPVIILIIINVVLFFRGRDGDLSSVANSYYETIVNKQYHRLLSSGFAHGNIMHIFFNMYSLYNIGGAVYYYLGFFWFVIIYFVCLIGGAYLSVCFHHYQHDDYTRSVGASGAICGLLGFYFVLLMMLGMDFASLGSYMIRVLIPMFITGLSPGIDGIGHISGLIVGMVCGFLFFWFIV